MRCVLTLTRPWLKLEKRHFINELPCHIVEGHQLTTVVCPNFPILKLCGCPNFNQCGWTSPKGIFGENTGLYPVKMIILFSSRTNRLQETYIVGNLSLLKPGTIRRGHETCSNQQLIVKGLTPSELCRISPTMNSRILPTFIIMGYSFLENKTLRQKNHRKTTGLHFKQSSVCPMHITNPRSLYDECFKISNTKKEITP